MQILFCAIGFFFLLTLGLYGFWFFAFRKNYRTWIPALAYHHVETHRGFPATKITAHQFERQMVELKEQGYQTLSADEFMALKRPVDKRVLISFDDSYASIARNALPLMASLNFTATLFVVSGFMGRKSLWDVSMDHPFHMTEAELKAAVRHGFTIGSHSINHPDLTTLSGARLKEELCGSKKRLEDIFGTEIRYLAYPFGRFNRRVQEAVRSAGYTAAFTINRPIGQIHFDPYCIPVTGIYGLDSMRNFRSKLTRNGCSWIEMMRDKIINRFASGTTLVKGTNS